MVVGSRAQSLFVLCEILKLSSIKVIDLCVIGLDFGIETYLK